MDDLVEIAVTVLVVGGSTVLVVGVVVWSIHSRKKKLEKWQAMAENLGLQFHDAGWFSHPQITGHYHGHPVRIHTYTTGSGKSRQTWTQVVVSLRQPLGLGLRIYREGFLSKIGKAIGTQDIEVGDRHFDDALMIKGKDPAAVTAYLVPDLRAAILQMFEFNHGMEFNDTGCTLTMHGWIADEALIVRWLDQMAQTCAVAQAGAGTGDADTAPPAPGGLRVTSLPE